MNDAATITPSSAELWVRYHRKVIISLAPVLLAGFEVIRDAAQTKDGLDVLTIVLAVLAAAQAVGVYLPGNTKAKLLASGVVAIGSGATAAAVGGLTMATTMLIVTQFLAWVAAGATENGPAPEVVRGEVVEAAPTVLPVEPDTGTSGTLD
ncbi:hypothetical protein [Kineosporia sp. NBRC 101731]|uniref:hypothetical protein n=1 Tax=Kineosporia sp. NBRC 101731 TaxID=3032199 RepID=UPI00249FC7DC|nr:hypothetical protein [Kineosporia sp. NBRC 101731]GLY32148.1 hypothetical protein Kisp02_55130 [Kineosporia sp. NBRC 101731]